MRTRHKEATAKKAHTPEELMLLSERRTRRVHKGHPGLVQHRPEFKETSSSKKSISPDQMQDDDLSEEKSNSAFLERDSRVPRKARLRKITRFSPVSGDNATRMKDRKNRKHISKHRQEVRQMAIYGLAKLLSNLHRKGTENKKKMKEEPSMEEEEEKHSLEEEKSYAKQEVAKKPGLDMGEAKAFEPIQRPIQEQLPQYVPFDRTSDLLSAIRKQPIPRAPVPLTSQPQAPQVIVPQPTYRSTRYNPGPPFKPNMKHAVIAYHIYFENEYSDDIRRGIEFGRGIVPMHRQTDILAGGIK